MRRLQFIRYGVSALACVAAAGTATAALAATQQQNPPTDTTEVIVTAQKKSERLLSVPVPVTAIQAGALVNENLINFKDYADKVPGLQYSGTMVSDISIRGITTGGGTNPTVAMLVDDVPFGSSTANGQQPIPDLDPSILDRVEVLRGPQGTLYGASSLGGLIKFVTKDPSTLTYSGRVEAGYSDVQGGRSGTSLRGAINVPIIKDVLGVSVSGFVRDDPAWINDIFPSYTQKNVNKVHKNGGRIALTYKPIDRLTINLSALEQDTATKNGTSIYVCEVCQTTPSSETTFDPIYGSARTVDTSPQSSTNRFKLYTARANLDLGWADLASISAWSTSGQKAYQDLTSIFGFLPEIYGVPNDSVIINNQNSTNKFSQELRLSGSVDKFDWLLGGFYTEEHSAINQVLNLYQSGSFSKETYDGVSPATYNEEAVFGNLTYHFDDKFNVQVGARLSHNWQSFSSDQIVDTTAAEVFGPTSYGDEMHSHETSTTWQVTPSYKFNDDLMAYGRIATGYRPGGPNVVVGSIPASFHSDTVLNSEIGLKGYALDHKMTVDVSLFQINWKNIQLPDTDTVTQFTFFTNGGTARSRGFEGAFHWLPVEHLNIDGNIALTDAVLTENLPMTDGITALQGLKGDRLPFSAKVTGNLSAQKTFMLSNGMSYYLGATWTYVGDRMSEFKSYDLEDPSTAPEPRFKLPAYNYFDLHAGLNLSDGVSLNAYVRNLTDEKGVVTATNRNGTSAPYVNFLQPTTYGLTVAKSF